MDDKYLNSFNFRFNQYEKEWFERYPNKNPTATLHDGMYLLMKKKYTSDVNRIVNIVAFILFGVLLLCLTLLPGIILFIYLVFIIAGVSFIIMGFTVFTLEYRSNYGRR